MCHRVQDDSGAKRQPFFVVVGVVGVLASCVSCARVRGRVSRSCATENTYIPGVRIKWVFSKLLPKQVARLCSLPIWTDGQFVPDLRCSF